MQKNLELEDENICVLFNKLRLRSPFDIKFLSFLCCWFAMIAFEKFS